MMQNWQIYSLLTGKQYAITFQQKLILKQKINNFRYAQLIYEDLVKQPIKTLSKMYQKFELPIDTWSMKAALR